MIGYACRENSRWNHFLCAPKSCVSVEHAFFLGEKTLPLDSDSSWNEIWRLSFRSKLYWWMVQKHAMSAEATIWLGFFYKYCSCHIPCVVDLVLWFFCVISPTTKWIPTENYRFHRVSQLHQIPCIIYLLLITFYWWFCFGNLIFVFLNSLPMLLSHFQGG